MKPLIGLYEEGTHNVVDIPECKGHIMTNLTYIRCFLLVFYI